MKPPVRIPRWACRRSSTVMTRSSSSVAAEQTSRPCLFAGQPKCACSLRPDVSQKLNNFRINSGSSKISSEKKAWVSGRLLLRHDADAGAAVRREVRGPRGHVRELRRAQLREPGWMGGWFLASGTCLVSIHPSLYGEPGGLTPSPLVASRITLSLTLSLTLALTLTN